MRPKAPQRHATSRSDSGENDMQVVQRIIRVLINEATAWRKEQNKAAMGDGVDVDPFHLAFKYIVAPDGYVPNSTVRKDVTIHSYKPYIEIQKESMVVKMEAGKLTPAELCVYKLGRPEEESIVHLDAARYRAMKNEAERFKMSSVYNESKKLIRLLERDNVKRDANSTLVNLKTRTARKLMLYRMQRKLKRMQLRRQLRSLAKQQIAENRRQEQRVAEFRSSRRVIGSGHAALSPEEFAEFSDLLSEAIHFPDELYSLLSGALKENPDENSVEKLISILGSKVNLEKYLAVMERPQNLLPIVLHSLEPEGFKIIRNALKGDFVAIYKTAKCVAFDLRVTTRLLRRIGKTLASATECLLTRACNFHHVEDFIQTLFETKMSELDLRHLVAGSYVPDSKPGEKPNQNPMLRAGSRMGEKAMQRFYQALHELNYRYFTALGHVQFEQPTQSSIAAESEKEAVSQYEKLLQEMTYEENRSILRPTAKFCRKLARQLLEIHNEGGIPNLISEYFSGLVPKRFLLICSQVLLEVKSGRSAIESLSFLMNAFLEVFVDTILQINRILAGSKNEDEVASMLFRIILGDLEEGYQLESLLEPNLARFLVECLLTHHGRVVHGVILYSLTAVNSNDIDDLLQDSLKVNARSPAKSLIDLWIRLTDLVFLLAEDFQANEDVESMQEFLRRNKFFQVAGCVDQGSIHPDFYRTEEQKKKIRATFMPKIARRYAQDDSSDGVDKEEEEKEEEEEVDPCGRRSKRRIIRKTKRRVVVGPRRLETETASAKDFFEEGGHLFTAQKAVINLDASASESESEKSLVDDSVFVSLNLDPDSAMESMTKHIKAVARDIPLKASVDKDQMDLIEDSWSALVELQSLPKSSEREKSPAEKASITLVKGLYYSLAKLTSWLGGIIGEDTRLAVEEAIEKTSRQGFGKDDVLTTNLWQELVTIKNTGIVKSVKETYGKFRRYLHFLQSELSDQPQFLRDVENDAVNYEPKEDVGSIMKQEVVSTRDYQAEATTRVQEWTTETKIKEAGLKETLAALAPPKPEEEDEEEEDSEVSFDRLLKQGELSIKPKEESLPSLTTDQLKELLKSDEPEPEPAPKPPELFVTGKGMRMHLPGPISVPRKLSYESESVGTSRKDSAASDTTPVVLRKVKTEINAIAKKVFPPRKKSVAASLFNSKLAELTEYLASTQGYDKSIAGMVAERFFKAGVSGASHKRMSRILATLLQEANERNLALRDGLKGDSDSQTDGLVDFPDLVASESTGTSVGALSSQMYSPEDLFPIYRSSMLKKGMSFRIKHREPLTLPSVSLELDISPGKPMAERMKHPLVGAKSQKEKSTLRISEMSSTISSMESPSSVDLQAPTGSPESYDDKLEVVEGRRLSRTSRKKSTIKDKSTLYESLVFSRDDETPSSEFTDKILDDDGTTAMKVSKRKPVRAPPNARISTAEAAEHIGNILEAVMTNGSETGGVIREVLATLANDSPEMEVLDKISRMYPEENTIFWQDGMKRPKMMEVFKEVVMESASKMMDHLDGRTKGRLMEQFEKSATQILDRMANVGALKLTDEDAQRLYDGMAALNANTLDEYSLQNVTPDKEQKRLRDGSQRWLRPIDFTGIFQPTRISKRLTSATESTQSVQSKTSRSSKTSRTSSQYSAFLIPDAALPFLPPEVVQASQKKSKTRHFFQILDTLEARIQRRRRMVLKEHGPGNQRDISKRISKVIQLSQRVQNRVKQRLEALGYSQSMQEGNRISDMSSAMRVVNRPSFIKPQEWTKLTGKNGLAAFRFGNSTLCHRGEAGAMGPLIRADATQGLSHKLVTNYDLAHVLHRHSLVQLTHMFSDN